jgi:hypothetical protein
MCAESERIPNRIRPYPNGTAPCGAVPRHFVPGYDRTVPPGHSSQALAALRITDILYVVLNQITFYILGMINSAILCSLLFCTFVCSSVASLPVEPPLAVRALVQGADPQANVEYCGAVSTSTSDYYLFLLQQNELAGVVLVRQLVGAAPVIVDADTSLFPFSEVSGRTVDKPVQDAIGLLLERRNRAKKSRPPQLTFKPDPEISSIGREIDCVIYPISGFRLGSNSTHEILRLLRTGPTVAVDPVTAPPGSIIVSPTRSSPYGPTYLGHAGILGTDGSIYSGDARYGGARTKNFTLTNWLRKFSSTNGSYAFVIHTPVVKTAQGL